MLAISEVVLTVKMLVSTACNVSSTVMRIPYFNGLIDEMHYIFLAAAPRSIRIVAQSSTTLNISWAAPVGTNRYILRYNISCSGSGVSWSQQTADNTTFSTIVTGLRPYTQYFCCISAIISTAEGAIACRISPRTPESGRKSNK